MFINNLIAARFCENTSAILNDLIGYKKVYEIVDRQINVEGRVSNFVGSTVTADGLAPLAAKASAD